MFIEVIFVSVFIAANCALIGNILVLRNIAMITDAISHSVLLGIVITYFFTLDISSPFQILGATLCGFLLVIIIETIQNTRLLKKDATIGVTFPLFFSIGVILISLYAPGAHLDQDVVLEGNLVFTVFDRITLLNIDLSTTLITSFFILLVNCLFFFSLYKEIKIAIFDPFFASTIGYKPRLLHYVTMLLLSLNSVIAFEAVGSILVIALFIIPPASACLLQLHYSYQVLCSLLIGVSSAILGCVFAWYFDLSLSGSIVTTTGVIFILTFLLNKRGALYHLIWSFQKRIEIHIYSLLVHLSQHSGRQDESEECNVNHIFKHLKWNKQYTNKVIEKAKANGYIFQKGDLIVLSDVGKQMATLAFKGTTHKDVKMKF